MFLHKSLPRNLSWCVSASFLGGYSEFIGKFNYLSLQACWRSLHCTLISTGTHFEITGKDTEMKQFKLITALIESHYKTYLWPVEKGWRSFQTQLGQHK